MRSKLEQNIISKSYQLIDWPESKFKHFTFLCRRNKILNISVNHKKTHPMCKRHGFRWEWLHSEISMLTSCIHIYREDFPRLKLYNVRINNTGQLAMSAPCFNCEAVLRLNGFREVFYTGEDGEFHKMVL